MSEARTRVVVVGEVMIELTRGADGRYTLACGGDTFNTAVYLARAGINTSLATALGDDPYSDRVLALAAAENIGRDLVLRRPGRLPSLRLIDGDPSPAHPGPAHPGLAHPGYCWCEAAPARDLFDFPEWSVVAQGLLAARMIYFSGITLSLYSNVGLGRFLAVVEMARQNGAKIAFDGNFRARGWSGDSGRIRAVFMEALKRVDIALPSFADEATLWGDRSPEATIDRLQAFGIEEIVVKNGSNGAVLAASERLDYVPVPEVIVPVDPTAAGDGFNAGYLAARLGGQQPIDAAFEAHRLAAQVIRHRGALMPRRDAAVH